MRKKVATREKEPRSGIERVGTKVSSRRKPAPTRGRKFFANENGVSAAKKGENTAPIEEKRKPISKGE